MYELMGSPKTYKLTKKLAKEFAEMEPAPRDRDLSERRLMVYRRVYEEGGFRPCVWAKAHCKETGETYRVNGKHTSTMFSGLDEIENVYVTIEEYCCETLEDVAKLYATFDSRTASRTTSEINASFAGTITALSGISKQTINLAVGGMSYHTWYGGFAVHPSAERAELLLDYPDFVIWLNEIYKGNGEKTAGNRHIKRQPVAAAMFGNWKKAKGSATEFWTSVREETSPNPNNPDRRLARYLLVSSIHSRSLGVKRSRSGDLREFYVKCLHAWNAWRKGETTNLAYHVTSKVPAIL